VAVIELRYDGLGDRLRSIGPVVVEYDRLGTRARWLGPHELQYDQLGTRLCAIGAAAIEYSRFTAAIWRGGLALRPCALGARSIEYADRFLGSRLHRIGSYEVRWEPGLGNVVRSVGPLAFEYGEGLVVHWAPKRVIVPGESTTLDDDDLITLYFVLGVIKELAPGGTD
jgi:hypothetical protein